MATTKVIKDLTELNLGEAGLKMPTGSSAYAAPPTVAQGMMRNLGGTASEGSVSVMQHYNGTEWKNFVNAIQCTTSTCGYPPTASGNALALYQMQSDGGTTNNVPDTCGNYSGTATSITYAAGKFGNAAGFNGSSSVISLGTSSPLNTFGGAQTISVWVKPSSASQEAIIGYRDDNSPYWWNLVEKMSNNTIRFLLGSTGNGQFVFNSVGTITLNQWNHIAITVDSTSAKIYINNGTAETLAGTPTSFSNSEPTSIGGDGTTDTDYFTGQIDQVRIYDSALDATQVESLYNEIAC